MRNLSLALLPAALLLACALPRAAEDATHAMSAQLVEESFYDVTLAAEKSLPPKFVLSVRREMPTPGWALRVDAVTLEPGDRIRVDMTEVPPEGNVSQVIRDVRFNIPLGPLPAGRRAVELRVRRGDAPHRLVQVVVLQAR